MYESIRVLLVAIILVNNASALSVQTPTITSTPTSSIKSKSPIFEYLKFDKNPQFDVLEKTKIYVESQSNGDTMSEDWYAEDYVLRGPVVGPITRADLASTQSELGIRGAFPNIELHAFGHSIDPENPYRCFYFSRWRGTNSGDLEVAGQVFPATGDEMETPVSVFSVVWNPSGKVVYEQVGAVVDRLEGNTQGKAAVFGLLHTAGLKLSGSPGNKVFQIMQRMGHLAGTGGRSWSKEENIPKWWISKSRGADGTEQI